MMSTIQTYPAIVVDIWMEHLAYKSNIRRFVGIVLAKV